MTKFCFNNWNKLPELITRCWKVERVEAYVQHSQKTRVQILQEAWSTPCVCGGKWLLLAHDSLDRNKIEREEWCDAVLTSLVEGRSKGTLVCHGGRVGNEGKSFLFTGLEAVYGESQVFTTPPKGSFPLLGLDRAMLVILCSCFGSKANQLSSQGRRTNSQGT